ncbi:hypothetical protein AeMF1_015703 [Aphanomyces euteiches]|nr:hypothetical protein AeMF1_015703 [Aphanomyces euteiches]
MSEDTLDESVVSGHVHGHAATLYYVFDHGPRRQNIQLALGTVSKLCRAKKMNPAVLTLFPKTRRAALEFQGESSSIMVDWVVWTKLKTNSNGMFYLLFTADMTPESCTLSGLLKPGKKGMGIEPTLSNVLKYRIPFPIPVHQILRVVNHEHVFSFERAPHSRLISRKKTKLLKALQEYSLVAHVHINGQAPNKSFARVERPQERYFQSGEEFDDIVSFVQQRLDKPRDATKLLLSLEVQSQRSLVQYTRQLVAEAQQGASADWIHRPLWVPAYVKWCDPVRFILLTWSYRHSRRPSHSLLR